ncbi:Hypothetical protein R9X50_00676300 [Acrodontium crateriforme]|uniref:Uncharacterized protein n=1 Tax=Acrodontium crateriforme TaxID=150365 RepID=A0AAQ3M9Q9_9PEZI|nr:Hypothetical protein R9X50_00676300 [Acrodontium crateriforme]
MSSAQAQVAYQDNEYGSQFHTGDRFGQQFDLNHPAKAMSSYQKLMHEHTLQQFEIAAESCRRRSSTQNSDSITLLSEKSNESIGSTAS